MKPDILVCFALKEEAVPFRKFASNKRGIEILITGIGRQNSEKSLRNSLARHIPSAVFTCGFAGALNFDLNPGDVVFSSEDEALKCRLQSTDARSAKIYCADRIAVTGAEKRALRQTTGADVIEMESEAIQSICRERGIPCATVRVISDTAREDLPLDFNALSKPDLSLDYGKLAWTIAKAPRKIGALIRLRKNCRFASEQLAHVLANVIG